jgi:general secretion pathway protein K
VALEESRLSTFLAADKNNTGGLTAEEQVDAFLSGGMVDAQSKLNVFNLINDRQVSAPDAAAFKKLFELLNLPATELENFTNQLKDAMQTNASPTASLMPQRVRQLTWLGMRPETLSKLTPYITLLPERTTVNINTASAEVIYAAVPGLGLADAKLTVSSRESAHFSSIADAATKVPALAGKLQEAQHSAATRFFEVSGRIRLEQTVVEEQSLVQRDTQSNVKTLWRERAVVAAADIVSNNSVAKP